ncbi:cysteine-rich venom protein kaouthin-2-like [Haliotis rubra]|uniref:cysteine-rich venom protein kaouthin-2-like n=1 Tax=Haliotis rubra TaxID=36100 RepID=UPI001EE610A5|nr:cysteine-rich venom protein kaouthin-2-like [Haliotis rubra]
MTTLRYLIVAITLTALLGGVRPDTDVGYIHGHRSKRSVTCKDKFKQIPNHSACRTKSSKASHSGVSADEKMQIVDLHNGYRNNVTPPASNMLKLSWDDQIAEIAQRWADVCTLNHDENLQRSIPGSMNLGQNLATNPTSWKRAVDLWYEEEKDFTYGGPGNVFGNIGHYTQVVWADTQKIGCGYTMCDSSKFYVCNYGPAGNIGGFNLPYKKNDSGMECGDEHLQDRLCNCNKTCLNAATVQRANCTCTCKPYPFYVGDECQLKCEDKDPAACDGAGASDCPAYATTCPNLCQVCPAGGIDYVEKNKQDRIRLDVILAAAMVALNRIVFNYI